MPEQCPCLDGHYFAYLLLLDPPTGDKLRARVLARIKSATEDGDGCLLLPKTSSNRQLQLAYKCPLDCGATWHRGGGRKDASGHKFHIRFGVILKLIHVYDTSGEEAALTLARRCKTLEVSHLCLACTDDLCVEATHFVLELATTNDRRIKHQNGNRVCNCAEFGDQPCMTNGRIGEKVFDDEGVHVGWKRAKGER